MAGIVSCTQKTSFSHFRLKILLLTAAALLLMASTSAAQCTLNPSSPSVTICSPANGSTVSSPVSVVAGTTDKHTVTAMKVYLDSVAVYTVHASQLSTGLTVSTGKHQITVNAWDSTGAVFKTTVIVTVSSTPAVSVSISPSPVSMLTNSTQLFTATVQNTSNPAVTWAVDTVTVIGNPDTYLYTAPATPGLHTVTATSVADATKSATAQVTVTSVPPITITISPTSVTLAPGGSQQFTATVQNSPSNTGVIWMVDGSLNSSSLVVNGATATYTAPASGTHQITAASAANIGITASATVTVTTTTGFPTSQHVFVVMLENQSFSQVFPSGLATNCNSSGMPYLCGLAKNGGLALNFYANVHGSLLDYLYNTSGSTWTASPTSCTGSACSSEGVITGDNIVRSLTANSLTWRGYFEDMPTPGYTGGDTADYLQHHNPFVWYSDVIHGGQQGNMYPFTQLITDVHNGALQNFNYIVPNAVHDADEGSGGSSALLAAADNWLNTNLSPLLSSPVFQSSGGDGILMVVFDEGEVAGKSGDSSSDNSCSPTQSSGCGGHVAFVMSGPQVIAGSTTSNTYHFQDMLHTIIHLLRASDYPNSASGAADIDLLPGVGQ